MIDNKSHVKRIMETILNITFPKKKRRELAAPLHGIES